MYFSFCGLYYGSQLSEETNSIGTELFHHSLYKSCEEQ